MMNVAERTRSNAPAEAQRWLARFEAALAAGRRLAGGK